MIFMPFVTISSVICQQQQQQNCFSRIFNLSNYTDPQVPTANLGRTDEQLTVGLNNEMTTLEVWEKISENFKDLINYLASPTFCIRNGKKTEWSPIRSVIIRVINKSWQPCSGSQICFKHEEFQDLFCQQWKKAI